MPRVEDDVQDGEIGIFVLAVGAEHVVVGGHEPCEIRIHVVLGAVVLHLEHI